MSDELDFLELELEREIRLGQQELLMKREKLVSTVAEVETVTTQLLEAKAELERERGKAQELKIQVELRLKAAQKLEEENNHLRDTIASLRVQVEAFTHEKQVFIDRCFSAETESRKVKNQLQELQSESENNKVFQESCVAMQAQTRNITDRILSKQELLDKDQIRLERCCQEGLEFARKVASRAEAQFEMVKRANTTRVELEEKLIKLSAAYEDVVKQRDKLLITENATPAEPNYLKEWESHQQQTHIRITGLLEQNNRLTEELSLLQINQAAMKPSISDENKTI